MMELTINGQVYSFNFGMGFLREANKLVVETVKDSGVKKNVGLNYMVAGLIDGDVEDLENALFLANMGQTPRLTRDLLDSYIDDPNTNIDELFSTTLDFLSKTNATRKATTNLLEKVEEMRASRS